MRKGRNPSLFAACLAASALFLAACATVPKQAWVEDTLYFGMSWPGGTVSEAQWRDFVDRAVTPRFPDGLTFWDASGQWRGSKGAAEREDSRVLEIVHADDLENDRKIQAIREAYKKRFHQESVLRVREAVRADF